mgnify:FL=1
MARNLYEKKEELGYHERLLLNLNPYQPLTRGYSLTFQNNTIVRGIASLSQGAPITTQFSDGNITSTIETVTAKKYAKRII